MSNLVGALDGVAGMRVLAVDDLTANTTLIRQMLMRAGLDSVTTLNDPHRVAATLSELEPDLVLLDLRMPGLDGYAVLSQIQRHAAGSFLPVVIITADDSRASIAHALGLGAHDFVAKPFEAVELVLRVRNLLQTRMAYQELRRSRAWLRSRLELFDAGLSAVDDDPDELRTLIVEAISDNSVDIALQPIVDMRDAQVIGSEALSRFPPSALPHPGAWFMAAEQVGLSLELEIHSARKALTLPAPEGHILTINVSPATVIAGLPSLLGSDVPWRRLVFELTEHVPVEDYAILLAALRPLRELGARIAIDDAGAGFASFRHIANLSPDFIKLDIGITRGIDSDPIRTAIAEMLSTFAQRMGISVIAEGVETAAERDTLLDLGLVLGQGYLLGRPEIVGT